MSAVDRPAACGCSDGPAVRPAQQDGEIGGRASPAARCAAITIGRDRVRLSAPQPHHPDRRHADALGERALLARRALRARGDRPQHRRRLRRACSTSATSPSSPSAPTRSACSRSAHGSLGFWARCRSPIGVGDAGRAAARHPHAAAARRLPRHRHPRLRRDHPHHRQQQRLARRPAGHHEHPPAARHRPDLHFAGLDAKPYYYLAFTFIIARDPDGTGARAQPRRAGVDRHP